jgi:hypothetical protein
MTIPLPYSDQYACRNETLEVYASDRRGTVLYQFNNLGYRNDIDYAAQDSAVGVYIGSSITAGIGIDWHKSFAYLASQQLETPAYHFAQGCKGVDNREILRMLEAVTQSGLDVQYFVLQFIDLDRRYDAETGATIHNIDLEQNINEFVQVFDRVCKVLEGRSWCFLGCDRLQHQLPEHISQHKNLVAWNPRFIDLAGVGQHPGEKWHRMISLGLIKHLKQTG